MMGKDAEGREICAFTESEIDALCDIIKSENISYLCTGHCTTLEGYDKVKKRLGDRVIKLTTGFIFEL